MPESIGYNGFYVISYQNKKSIYFNRKLTVVIEYVDLFNKQRFIVRATDICS